MATAVVSGRVDEEIKRKADIIIERAGKTTGDVIRDIWANIVITGELPTTKQQEEEFLEKRRRFKAFMELVESLPPAPPWFATMTDEEMRDMMVEDMLEKERHFVGGDLYVPTTR